LNEECLECGHGITGQRERERKKERDARTCNFLSPSLSPSLSLSLSLFISLSLSLFISLSLTGELGAHTLFSLHQSDIYIYIKREKERD
jgi:hypothetical protein